MKKYTIFYSWQSDLPNATNRGLIEKALENAAKTIRADDSLKVEPAVDRDILGVAGSPDIGKTILDKIDHAHIFVADVSIINRREKKPSPNPNVLIELGYAMKALGPDKYLMVMNTAYGSPEELPFDLRSKYVITYKMPEEESDRASERRALEGRLEAALRTIIGEYEATPAVPEAPSIADQLKSAIESGQPNQDYLARKHMEMLLDRIISIAPDLSTKNPEDELDERLVRAIDASKPIVLEFCRVAELIAAMNAGPTAHAVYKGFGRLLERYKLPAGVGRSYRNIDFDFFKFLGHELFVVLFALLIRENRWEMVADLLEEDIFVPNAGAAQEGLAVPFTYASQPISLLEHRNNRLQLRRISVHADILNARYVDKGFAAHVTARDISEADYFLFLRSVLHERKTPFRSIWRPPSALYLEGPPRFLQEATPRKTAERLLRSLGVKTIDLLREGLSDKAGTLPGIYGVTNSFAYEHPLTDFNIVSIGSR